MTGLPAAPCRYIARWSRPRTRPPRPRMSTRYVAYGARRGAIAMPIGASVAPSGRPPPLGREAVPRRSQHRLSSATARYDGSTLLGGARSWPASTSGAGLPRGVALTRRESANARRSCRAHRVGRVGRGSVATWSRPQAPRRRCAPRLRGHRVTVTNRCAAPHTVTLSMPEPTARLGRRWRAAPDLRGGRRRVVTSPAGDAVFGRDR